MAQMSINTDVVGAAVNQISNYIDDIATRTKKFCDLVSEKNAQTNNKWTLLKTLEEKLAQETKNVNDIITSMDEIKSALDKYAEVAAEVDDDSDFK